MQSPEDNVITLFHSNDFALLSRAEQTLEKQDIKCFMADQHASDVFGVGFGSSSLGMRFMIMESDTRRAVAALVEGCIVQNLFLYCPECHSLSVELENTGFFKTLLYTVAVLLTNTYLPAKPVKFSCKDCGNRWKENKNLRDLEVSFPDLHI